MNTIFFNKKKKKRNKQTNQKISEKLNGNGAYCNINR